MDLHWYEMSQDGSRFTAECGTLGVKAVGHTADVALERLRWAIGAQGDGEKFSGELRAGKPQKSDAERGEKTSKKRPADD